ncbi:hypothetical protein [Kribbella sp. NPDC006257]|uniref:hypothetical protein n=1 Tax=Kribbella sp. NPDC006257 TaxID=3156738 RepID=UPI0033A45692
MKREDVHPLLVQAVDAMFEPDLADDSWAAAVAIRRRRRRSVIIVVVATALIAAVAGLIAGLSGGKAGITPPTTLPSAPAAVVPPAGTIAGADYWIAPQAASERYLDHLETPMGDSLRFPDSPANLSESPVDRIAAVVLTSRSGSYDPLLLGSDGKWARADVRLSAIGTGAPLSTGAVAPNGKLVAFPQPGALLVLDATNAGIQRFNVPNQDLRSVSWLPDSHRVLISGPNAAYRILISGGGFGERAVTVVEPSIDPDAATAPYRLDDRSGQVALSRYSASNGWTVSGAADLPVQSWVGQTFGSSSVAARLFVASNSPQVPNAELQPQIVAAISAQRSLPNRLLVLGPSPPPTAGTLAAAVARPVGCCLVLGWYDENTVLIQVQGWVIAWNVQSGHVRRVTELEVSGLALGPGVRG